MNDPEKLARLYARTDDPDEQSRVIARLPEIDTPAGARLVLLFLRSNPPRLFRQIVVEDFERITGRASGFDMNEPFDTPGNQKAAARMAESYDIIQ